MFSDREVTDRAEMVRRERARWHVDRSSDIFDERGIIRDGKSLRVPVSMMDSASPPRWFAEVPRTISTGLIGEYRLSKFFFPDGSPKERETRDRAEPNRRASRRLARQATSGSPTSTTDAAKVAEALAATKAVLQRDGVTVDQNSSSKPGFRFGDAGSVDPGQALKDAAYEEMCRELTDAWKPKDAAVFDTPVKPAAAAAAVADVVLPRSMTAADAQKIKDEAWNAYVSDLTNAWKS